MFAMLPFDNANARSNAVLLLCVLLGRHLAAPASAASATGRAWFSRRASRSRDRAFLTVPRALLRSLRDRSSGAGFAAAPASARAAPGARSAWCLRTAAPAPRQRAGKVLDRSAHQFDRADPGVDDVLQRRLSALIRHAAIAVRDRPDLHAVDQRVWFRRRERPED